MRVMGVKGDAFGVAEVLEWWGLRVIEGDEG